MKLTQEQYRRLAAKFVVDHNSGCWIWFGSTTNYGYGRFVLNGSLHLPHRLLYEHLISDIPQGKELHHTCGNKSCVNPQHMKICSHKEHSALHTPYQQAITHCPRGHPYGEENTRYQPDGKRYCKACKDERREETREKQNTQFASILKTLNQN